MGKTINKNIIRLSAILSASIAIYGCNSGSSSGGGSSSSGVTYTMFPTYTSQSGSSTIITGIRGINNGSANVYISGIYTESATAASNGLVYIGSVGGSGTWYELNNPGESVAGGTGESVTSTSLYGPDNNGFNSISVVGSYTTESSGANDIAVLYQGAVDGSGIWTTLDPSPLATRVGDTGIHEAFAHSNMGGFVVGNFDTNLLTGRAFIYNITTESMLELIKPGATSITAYGIWYNGGSSYTIAGGYSDVNQYGIDVAYLVDWDSVTESTSNWESYTYNNSLNTLIITHFEGITTDGGTGYNLAADFESSDFSGGGAAFAHITRNSDGSFNSNASWTLVGFPGAGITSANTVYQNYILGVYTIGSESGVANPFVAAIP